VAGDAAPLLHGAAAVGKTRTMLQILWVRYPEYRVLVPRSAAAVRELFERLDELPRSAIVLDDLERYLRSDELHGGHLGGVGRTRGIVICLATMGPRGHEEPPLRPQFEGATGPIRCRRASSAAGNSSGSAPMRRARPHYLLIRSYPS